MGVGGIRILFFVLIYLAISLPRGPLATAEPSALGTKCPKSAVTSHNA